MKNFFLITLLTLICGSLNAQSKFYSLIEAGANLGFANEGYEGSFSGYSAHVIFGKNYNNRAYLGLGIGNEKLSGTYESIDPSNSFYKTKFRYDRQLFPIFIDGRLPIGEFNTNSKIGLLANAGYAPSIAANYDKGFLFKGGFFYLKDNSTGLSWTASASYAYQALAGNIIDIGKDIQHQSFNLSIGILLK